MEKTMTIKQLADILGVSKTAVRKYMTEEFRSEHVETDRNGVITIDSDGCKLIAMHLGRTQKLTEPTENEIPETDENTATITIPMSVYRRMEQQIDQLQADLAEERNRSRELADKYADKFAQLADQAQQLQQLQLLPEKTETRKKGFFSWFSRK